MCTDHRLNLWHAGKWSRGQGDEGHGCVAARLSGRRNHTINVIIYQKARLSPHKPKCQRLNPGLIKAGAEWRGQEAQRRLTISVVYANINRLVTGESVTG